jgi:hypothetical protein
MNNSNSSLPSPSNSPPTKTPSSSDSEESFESTKLDNLKRELFVVNPDLHLNLAPVRTKRKGFKKALENHPIATQMDFSIASSFQNSVSTKGNVSKKQIESSLKFDFIQASSLSISNIPFFSNFVGPCVLLMLDKFPEVVALLDMTKAQIHNHLAHKILDGMIVPSFYTLEPDQVHQKSYSDLVSTHGLKTELYQTSSDQDHILDWLHSYVVIRSHVHRALSEYAFCRGLNILTPTPATTYLLNWYKFSVPRPFSEGMSKFLKADFKQNFTTDFSMCFKSYCEFIKRIQYSLSEHDPFEMQSACDAMSSRLHHGIFTMTAFTHGYSDWIPGVTLLNKTEKIVDSVGGVDTLLEDLRQAAKTATKAGDNVNDLFDQGKVDDLLDRFKTSADSAAKVGDEFANVIEMLRHSIPIFGVFFLITVWVSFRKSSGQEKIDLKSKLIGLCLFVGASYIAVPGIWDIISRINREAEEYQESSSLDLPEVPTQGFDLSEDAVSTICTLGLLVGFSQPDKLSIANVLKPLGTVSRGVRDLIRVAYELFCMFSENVSEFFGLDPKIWGTPSVKFNEWKIEVEALQTNFSLGRVEVSIQSENKIEAIIQVGESMMMDYAKSVHQPLTPLIRQCVNELTKIKLTMSAMRLNYKPNKPAAVGLFLFGPPAQGKTELTKFIEAAVMKRIKSPEEYETYLKFPSNYVASAPRGKYWDSISSSLDILKIPEFGQFPKVRGTPEDGDAYNIIMFCDPDPAIVNISESSNKNKVSLQPVLLMVTSNQEFLQAEEINSIDALQRRLDIPIRVMLKEGSNREVISPDNWILTLQRPLINKTGKYEPIGDISLEQLVLLIVEKIERSNKLNNSTAEIVKVFSQQMEDAIEKGDLKLLDDLQAYVKPFAPAQTDIMAESQHLRPNANRARSAVVHSPPEPEMFAESYHSQDDDSGDDDTIEDVFHDALTTRSRGISERVPTHVGKRPIVPKFKEGAKFDERVLNVVEGPGVANIESTIVEFSDDHRIVHVTSLETTETVDSANGTFEIRDNGKGVFVPMPIRQHMSFSHTTIGYDTFVVPDHVPYFHGVALKYPLWKFSYNSYKENDYSQMVEYNSISTDEIWKSFSQTVCGVVLLPCVVKDMMVKKFGSLEDFTANTLLLLSEHAKIHGAAKIGFVLDVSLEVGSSLSSLLKTFSETMMSYAEKFRNKMYSVVRYVYKWMREHEQFVTIGISLVTAYLAYTWWKSPVEISSIVNSGNGNINASRELKHANVAKAQSKLATLARNYRATVHSGDSNARSRVDVCVANMVPVYGIRGGADALLGHALFLEERTFIMPGHFVLQTIALQSEQYTEEEMYLTFVFQGKPTKVLLQWLDPVVEEYIGDNDVSGRATLKDLSMYKLLNPSLCPKFRSIVKHIALKKEIDTFKGGKDYFNAAVINPKREVPNLKVWRQNIVSIDPILKQKNNRTYLAMYEGACFTPGSCGDILMTAEGRIIGFHTNGDGKYGYSTVFYQEMFAPNLVTPISEISDKSIDLGDLAVALPSVMNHGYDLSVHTGSVITLESEFKSSTFVKNSIVQYKGLGNPYVERKTAVTNTHISNYAQARAKYVLQEVTASDDHVNLAMEQMFSDATAFDSKWNKRMYTLTEAVCGIPDSMFKKLPTQTSAGFPLSALGIRKTDYFYYDEDGQFRITNKFWDLKEEIQKYFHVALTGATPVCDFQDTLKNERRAIDKVEKPRLVSVSPLVLSIVCRMVFGSFMEYMNTYAEKIGCVYMTNPMSLDWDRIARKLRDKGGSDRFGAGDFSGFDAHHLPRYMMMLFDKIISWYPKDGLEDVRRAVAENICYSVHHFGSVVEVWNSGMPSGNPMTTVVNCLLNRTYFMYWWFTVNGKDPVCLPHFKEHVSLFVNGDDNVYGVTEQYAEVASEEQIGAVFKELGQVYTDDKKLGATKNLRPFENVTLSKRSFRFDHELGLFVGPLDLDVVLEIPLWTKRDRYLEIALDNAAVSLRELSVHGKEVYEFWAPKICEYFGDKFTPITTSWKIQYAIALSSEAQV